ncbi:hypothetical protein [Massilia sp. PWRC2]|uniref:hypothetical protein n=1 Tax=Massilia sp. PWRC2 TaxID=2804626 RepID=UPI003CEAAF80
MDYSQFSTDDLKAMQAGDISKVSSAGLKAMQAQAHMAPPAKEEPGMLASLAAGAGKGLGSMALGAQRLYGKVLETADDIMPGKLTPTMSDVVAGRKPRNSLSDIAHWLGSDADAGKAKLEAENAPYKAANPLTNATGEVGGSIVATLPVGAAIPNALRAAAGARAVVGVVPRAAQAAGVGAIYGGVTGTAGSNADTLGGMLADGAKGAGTGALLGGGAMPVTSVIGAVGGNVMQRVSKTSAVEYAKQKVAEALARDARGTLATSGATNPLAQVSARFNRLGEEATLTDAAGRNTNQLLDTLATLPGRTKDAAYNLLRQRTAGVGDRMRSAAESALDTNGQRLPTTVESLITRRQTDSGPLYAKVRQTVIQPTQALADTLEAADNLGMVELGRKIATARQLPFTLDSQQNTRWNMGDLDHVKQGIDQALTSRAAQHADGTLTPLGASFLTLKNSLVKELDAATTNQQTGVSLYRQARDAFSNPSKLIDAANAGKLAVNRDEASILSNMRGMSDNETQAFRIGAFEGLRAKLGTQGGQTNIMNMWKEPATQEKLKAIFGDERSYREFAVAVAKEAQLKRLQNVGSGSQTAARAAGMGDLDMSALTDAGGALAAAKSGNALSALVYGKNAWNRVATPQSVRDQMGNMLLSKGVDGSRNLNSLGELVQVINNRNMLLSTNVGQLGGQIGGQLLTPMPTRIK